MQCDLLYKPQREFCLPEHKLDEIAREYNCIIVYVSPEDTVCKKCKYASEAPCSCFRLAPLNTGYTIRLASYDDPEIQAIAFFHELGHKLCHDVQILLFGQTQYGIERMAWKVGLLNAKRRGIIFSNHAKKWAEKCLASYRRTKGSGL